MDNAAMSLFHYLGMMKIYNKTRQSHLISHASDKTISDSLWICLGRVPVTSGYGA